MTQPLVSVGIISSETLTFQLSGIFSGQGENVVTGRQEAHVSPSGIGVEWNGKSYPELLFTPTSPDGDSFTLEGVTIGVNFHWERKEDQRFRGSLRIIVDGKRLTAINILGVEDYLISVISSEMSATSSLPLLRAHAVISRSWLLSMMEHKELEQRHYRNHVDEIIRWWDREDHSLFDVCADDHCQRYQGIGRISSYNAASAVNDTRGEVLMYGGQLCDTRFSKCCGGAMEVFSSCWEDMDKPYLKACRDSFNPDPLPVLAEEKDARRWIEGNPSAFCNTADERILSQVLNSYDREHPDFYRWEVTYSQDELRTLISSRLDLDPGAILDLWPVLRGPSGRIVKLRIVGSEAQPVIGKELMIRRTLSKTHLRSSAFTVERLEVNSAGVPTRFRLRGAGWGHGVGLCQIGAAVMGERGYSYEVILRHYYPGATLSKLY